jgi:hypothetical protein
MSSPAIDYGALAAQNGALTKPTMPPAPGAAGGIDYAALAQKSGAVATTPANSAPAPGSVAAGQRHWWETGTSGTDTTPGVDNTTFLKNAGQGVTQAIAEPFDTLFHAVRKIPGLGDFLAKHAGLDTAIAEDDAEIKKPLGEGSGLGHAAVTTGEFVVGDAELKAIQDGLIPLAKGANFAEKAKAIQPILKAAVDHPHIAKTLLTAVRQGALGTVQAAAHGADLPTALETGAITGATGGATEGATEGFQNAREGAASASEATAAHEAAPAVVKERAGAMTAERQAVAQGRVKDVAKDAARNSIARFNEAQAPALTMTGEPVTEANFEPADEHAAAAATNSFGDAADQIRSAAKPVYEKIDEATGGKFAQLQADRAKAFKANDGAGIDKADDAIDGLLTKTEGVAPQDLAAAKSAWKDSKILDKLHSATEGAFNGITEEMAAQPGTSARLLKSGNSNGGTLQARIGNMLRKPGAQAQVESVIGKEGVKNLYTASHLVSTPELRAATQKLAEEVAKNLPALPKAAGSGLVGKMAGAGVGASAATMLGHPMWAPVAAAAGAGAETMTRAVLNKMVTSPRIGELMDFAVRNNIAPRTAGALIATEMQRGNAQ